MHFIGRPGKTKGRRRMTLNRWALALLAAFLIADQSSAQGLGFPSPYGYGYFTSGAEATFARRRARTNFQLRVGVFRRGGYVLDPFGPSWCGPVNRVTVFYSAPPPVVVLPQFVLPAIPFPRQPLDDDDPGFAPVPRNRDGFLKPEMPGDPPPVPDLDDKKDPPPKKEELKPKPLPKKDPPKEPPKPPRKPAELPRRPAPEDDPKAEFARLMDVGQEAFTAQELGRAVLRFKQAIQLAPREPMAHFLLAQALMALGKYHAAYDAIQAGMELRPDWPTAAFRPLDLYGANVADYPEHLAALEAALERHPGDPILLFLNAYSLWFDGRQEDATPLFHRARKKTADAETIDRFLRALPPARTL
jgi:hypothetical protein